MDWSLFHAINSAVATHDSIEDPVTLLGAFAVALYAAAIVALWFVALLEHVWAVFDKFLGLRR